MKRIIFLLLLTVAANVLVVAQELKADSIKQVILQEVISLINQSELKTENSFKQLSEQVKQIVESNKQIVTNDAAINLSNSAKEEAVQQANELIEGKGEKILVEVENMINQSKSTLKQELEQMIKEGNKQASESNELVIHNSEEKTIKKATELIDEKFSEVHQFIVENIQGENQNLIDKITEQGDLISDLLKRVEELEKK